ncbi:MAG: exodeoxyribonuclease VII small subunit [Rhizobacter sp.]|nr:exodeoxyribonuclease VII small subunit [Rhizobacter sp.]
MATDPSPSAAAEPVSCDVAVREFESVVASLEGGQPPLEGLLAGCWRGDGLLQCCRPRLEAVAQQVKILEDGHVRPWSQS